MKTQAEIRRTCFSKQQRYLVKPLRDREEELMLKAAKAEHLAKQARQELDDPGNRQEWGPSSPSRKQVLSMTCLSY